MPDASFIPYGRHWIDQDDISSVLEVLKGDRLTCGPAIEKFERALAEYCEVKFAVACSSGTAALHLAQLALETKPGDSVVTTPNTFLASANCVRFVGADVVFADIEPDTANIDPEQVEMALSRENGRCAAGIIPVHFAGHPADMERLCEIAMKHNCWIVEDACHALGARYVTNNGENVMVGSCRHSDMTAFSFHPVKHIAMGEGGAITTNNDILYNKLILFRNHCMEWKHDPETPWAYEMSNLGFNYRLSDIHAALGRSQLKKLDRFVSRRRQIAGRYREALAENCFADVARPLAERDGYYSSYHLFPVRIRYGAMGVTRGELMSRLKSRGIGTQAHYIPVHLQPYYKNLYKTVEGYMPEAESYFDEALSLPVYPKMTDEEVGQVIKALRKAVNEKA